MTFYQAYLSYCIEIGLQSVANGGFKKGNKRNVSVCIGHEFGYALQSSLLFLNAVSKPLNSNGFFS